MLITNLLLGAVLYFLFKISADTMIIKFDVERYTREDGRGQVDRM